MKRIFIIFLVVLMLAVSGCSSENHLNESSVSETIGTTQSQQEQTETSQTDTQSKGSAPTDDERSTDANVETSKPVSTETAPQKTESTPQTDNKEPAQSVTSSKPSSTTSTVPDITDKKPETTESTETTKTPPEPEEVKASADDVKKIAEKMVVYINEYRAEQGVQSAKVLSGLTQYAEYRSKQLVSNFAHDVHDEREAATQLKYGEYVDPCLYGMTGEPYYTANAREAIAKTDFGGTIDAVAKRLARLARNSSSHWSYVGGAEYGYIAIGVTYHNGVWYCDIAMSSTNTYN